ncbi:N-acetylglucosamine kinase [Microbacterium sp. 1.5R]|uniref:N-acetylglucosamine kinase n=1 Tax=Microbacterium sp. 1.5R TaxID=1916917 RepID=UPI0011A827EE|nr:BadF/BadG/BcrA/BcrD ATPase family protein [Microbacterium sp. 1.5R]
MLHRPVLAVDLGKSRCRVAMSGPNGQTVSEGIGSPGLAAAGGVEAALAAILPLTSDTAAYGAVSVGAAGAWAAPAAASELAQRLHSRLDVPVAVTSDVVSAHAGALDGGEGVLLIAGTGAAALGIDGDGIRLIDGWGPEVGDLGSGSWFGRAAVRAALRASAGLVGPTALSAGVEAMIGPIDGIQAWLSRDEPLARRLAALAPVVLNVAADGDAVAGQIAGEGARLLVDSAVAASARSTRVALHGGLTQHDWFRGVLADSLRTAGREPVDAVGDALDGARLIAERAGAGDPLPHERFVRRAG